MGSDLSDKFRGSCDGALSEYDSVIKKWVLSHLTDNEDNRFDLLLKSRAEYLFVAPDPHCGKLVNQLASPPTGARTIINTTQMRRDVGTLISDFQELKSAHGLLHEYCSKSLGTAYGHINMITKSINALSTNAAIPSDRQRLLFEGAQIEDGSSFDSYSESMRTTMRSTTGPMCSSLPKEAVLLLRLLGGGHTSDDQAEAALS